MHRRRALRLVLPVVSLAVLGCAAEDPSPATESGPATGAVEAPAEAEAEPGAAYARSLGVDNAREPLPGILTAAQPSPEQARALTEAGYGTFVSLRPTAEEGAGWEEEAGAETRGDFHRLAIAGADDLTRERVEALDRILAEAGEEPVVLYCASSNRVGALLALRAHWLQGASPEEALALGREAGLTRLEPVVVDLMDMDQGG